MVYVPILSSFWVSFTHIIVRRKSVIGPDILATPESTLALTVSITIPLAYFTRSKISTVVHMPVLTSFWISFTYIIVCPESVKCPDISAAIETILALTVAIAITFAYRTRSKISTVVYMPVRPDAATNISTV